jgi:H/ACA ribonucleoprotein complex subunit 4
MRVHQPPTLERVREVLQLFQGEIWQRPPVKSSVARRLRKRTIYYTELLEAEGKYVLFKVGCQAGTYIRKLCFDYGEVLGCGANMEELRRTRTGLFGEDTLCTLQDLHDAHSLWLAEGDERPLRCLVAPMEASVAHWKKIIIRDSAVDPIARGANLAVQGILSLDSAIAPGDDLAIMTQKGELVAIGQALLPTDRIMGATTGLAVLSKRVFMVPGFYPKWTKHNPPAT